MDSELIITGIITLTAAIIGATAAIYGGHKATQKQLAFQEELFERELKARRKESRIEAKHKILSEVTGNIAVISDGSNLEQNGDSVKFFGALNQVNLVFNDAPNVISANQIGVNTGEDLYKLISEMHKDLGLPLPEKESVLSPKIKRK
ncbi:hypothetical protein [Salipaludibacillus aurantiacus]|uniref:Uncharacterized protein n=1 Tax=Salipaludibacillus aurantiacus TaxID=1601833 RepID=A0A1H9Q151_9BACI|nr:hypothetical protein [Salipaludibacillus aurantiacus]SER54316.1 hypothetical protein SAMN05518684_1025 [Salipaludibacillus aurantiacus]